VGNYEFLLATLNLHASQVTRHIIIHDTVIFGHCDEFPDPNRSLQRQGMCAAILDFLEHTPEGGRWKLKAHYPGNNGLTVLQRI
jgi:hypothetical protein